GHYPKVAFGAVGLTRECLKRNMRPNLLGNLLGRRVLPIHAAYEGQLSPALIFPPPIAFPESVIDRLDQVGAGLIPVKSPSSKVGKRQVFLLRRGEEQLPKRDPQPFGGLSGLLVRRLDVAAEPCRDLFLADAARLGQTRRF